MNCGPEYKQGSYGCGACASGYYESFGACMQCPAPIRAVGFAAGMVFILLLISVTAVAVRERAGGSLKLGFLRVIGGVLWLCCALQFVEVVLSTAVGLPSLAQFILTFLSLVSLDFTTTVLHPSCSSFSRTYPSLFFVAVGLALIAMAVLTRVNLGIVSRYFVAVSLNFRTFLV